MGPSLGPKLRTCIPGSQGSSLPPPPPKPMEMGHLEGFEPMPKVLEEIT